MNEGQNILAKIKRRTKKTFILPSSVKELDCLLGGKLPNDDVFKVISLNGGLASLTFIKYVADRYAIEELTASTLRIGEKQFNYLIAIKNGGKLKKARFFVSTMQKQLDNMTSGKKYNYYKRYESSCRQNGWKNIVVNNHSKIILMRTNQHYFVLETSSNLNENPKIEQYSFSDDKQLYDFYYDFFNQLETSVGT